MPIQATGNTGSFGGADTSAIHDDTAGEINAITEKATPVAADLILIEDSAAGNVKKKAQVGNLSPGSDYVLVYKSATQSVNDITATAVTFDLEIYDTDGMHDNVTNNTRLTCQTAGTYVIFGRVVFAKNPTAGWAAVRLGGSTYLAAQYKGDDAVTASYTAFFVYVIRELAATNYVELVCQQTTGGAMNIQNGVETTQFGMFRIN